MPEAAAAVATTGLRFDPYGTITAVFEGVFVIDAVGVSLGVSVLLAVGVGDGVADTKRMP
jgi:hypothetical protein